MHAALVDADLGRPLDRGLVVSRDAGGLVCELPVIVHMFGVPCRPSG
jgi:hypothetical protein